MDGVQRDTAAVFLASLVEVSELQQGLALGLREQRQVSRAFNDPLADDGEDVACVLFALGAERFEAGRSEFRHARWHAVPESSVLANRALGDLQLDLGSDRDPLLLRLAALRVVFRMVNAAADATERE